MKEIILLDTSIVKNVLIHSGHVKPELQKNPELFKHYFLNQILALKKQFSCNTDLPLILAIDKKKVFDVNGEKIYGYWRDVMYNKNISKMSPHNRFKFYKDGRQKSKDDGLDWEILEKSYWECINLLKDYSDIKVILIPGIEADDILAVLSQRLKLNSTIITIDKDLRQCISNKTKYFNYRTKKYETDSTTDEENLLFYLKGDSGDAIPGVKFRYRWKANLEKKSLKEIFAEYPDENLEERLAINKKLMDLSVSNIPKSVQKAIIQEYKKEQGNYNQLQLQIHLKKMGVGNMTNGVESIVGRSDEFKLAKYSVNSYTTKKHNRDMEKITSIKNKFL